MQRICGLRHAGDTTLAAAHHRFRAQSFRQLPLQRALRSKSIIWAVSMFEFSVILNSDSVNRYGMQFPAGELQRALEAHWRTGLPNCISHDAHRLLGWTLPTHVSVVPGLTRLHGVT